MLQQNHIEIDSRLLVKLYLLKLKLQKHLTAHQMLATINMAVVKKPN